MKIFLNENKFASFLTEMMTEFNNYDGNSEHNPYNKKIDNDINSLEKLISNDGRIMINIKNGKEYYVYELLSLANLIGKRYGLCQLIKDYEPYGAVSAKPMELFKLKNY